MKYVLINDTLSKCVISNNYVGRSFIGVGTIEHGFTELMPEKTVKTFDSQQQAKEFLKYNNWLLLDIIGINWEISEYDEKENILLLR